MFIALQSISCSTNQSAHQSLTVCRLEVSRVECSPHSCLFRTRQSRYGTVCLIVSVCSGKFGTPDQTKLGHRPPISWSSSVVYSLSFGSPTSPVMYSSQLFIVPLCIVLLVAHLRKKKNAGRPLPPGPPPTPVLGNIRGIDTRHPWKTYARWGEEYGSFLHGMHLGTD